MYPVGLSNTVGACRNGEVANMHSCQRKVQTPCLGRFALSYASLTRLHRPKSGTWNLRCEAGNTVTDVRPTATPDITTAPIAVAQAPESQLYMPAPAAAQEYYLAAPPPPVYPVQPARSPVVPETNWGVPWFIWMGLGFLVASVASKVQEAVKKGPQEMMAEMMMKQMMNAMAKQQGGQPSPFGAGTSPPFGSGPMPPFGGASSPFAYPPAGTTVDTTATPVQPFANVPTSPYAPVTPDADKPGERFSSRLGTQVRTPETNGMPLDVVEPEVKEPAARVAQPSESATSKPFFTDVTLEQQQAKSGADSSTASTTEGSTQGASQMTSMVEKMLRDPNMQKLLYPYLPEPMRNPQSIEWMLNNPEVKKQIEATLQQQGTSMDPKLLEMMKGMDFNQDRVNAQFQEMGLKPEDVVNKVLSNPELAAGFANPKVQAAIFDISQNPMNITKYQSDPEVMKVLEKVTEIFSPQVNPNMR